MLRGGLESGYLLKKRIESQGIEIKSVKNQRTIREETETDIIVFSALNQKIIQSALKLNMIWIFFHSS